MTTPAIARDPVGPSAVSPVPLGRLWVGVVLAPAAWTVAELAGYVLAALSCEPGPIGIAAGGTAFPRATQLVVSAVAALAAVYGLVTALQSGRMAHAIRPPSDRDAQVTSASAEPWGHGTAPGWGRARFMSAAGIFTSGLFLLGIVLFGIPPALVNACSRVH
jgi:hypothetical protein